MQWLWWQSDWMNTFHDQRWIHFPYIHFWTGPSIWSEQSQADCCSCPTHWAPSTSPSRLPMEKPSYWWGQANVIREINKIFIKIDHSSDVAGSRETQKANYLRFRELLLFWLLKAAPKATKGIESIFHSNLYTWLISRNLTFYSSTTWDNQASEEACKVKTAIKTIYIKSDQLKRPKRSLDKDSVYLNVSICVNTF